MPIIYRLNTEIRLTMLCLSGFELYIFSLGAPEISVVWMFNAIKVTAFASARPVSQQTKVFLTPRFALLADGSLMPLNLLFVILHYKEFNFAWVRHRLPCILFVICRTFRSTQGLVYLVGGHARATPQCRVCMRWWSERGCIISYKDSAVRFFIAESVSLYSKKKRSDGQTGAASFLNAI